eukprot:757558-Hanusia_phi.AAC.1
MAESILSVSSPTCPLLMIARRGQTSLTIQGTIVLMRLRAEEKEKHLLLSCSSGNFIRIILYESTAPPLASSSDVCGLTDYMQEEDRGDGAGEWEVAGAGKDDGWRGRGRGRGRVERSRISRRR